MTFSERSAAAMPYAVAAVEEEKTGPCKVFMKLLIKWLPTILEIALMADHRAQAMAKSSVVGAGPTTIAADYSPRFLAAIHKVEGRQP